MQGDGTLELYSARVVPEWVDYNGHLNDAYYALIFSQSGDKLLDYIGLDAAVRAETQRTIYTTSLIIHYLREVKLDEDVRVFIRLLEFDAKRLRLWFELRRASGDVAALSEQVYLSIDKSGAEPKATRFSDAVLAKAGAMFEAQKHLPLPARAGKGISLSRV